MLRRSSDTSGQPTLRRHPRHQREIELNPSRIRSDPDSGIAINDAPDHTGDEAACWNGVAEWLDPGRAAAVWSAPRVDRRLASGSRYCGSAGYACILDHPASDSARIAAPT